jgi:uncharacterized repeat protein (TIGR01451 family)/fimbrial isopeptide formation D2 family protein
MKGFLQQQDGISYLMVMAFMVLAVPLATAALGLASTLSIDSRIKTGLAKEHYAILGAAEHALYRLLYESGYAISLEPGVPDTYAITLNGQVVTVTIEKLGDVSESGAPTSGETNLTVTKTVDPTTAQPDTLTTFTYTITVKNENAAPVELEKLFDGLPPGFTYFPGSSSGLTTLDPSITIRQGQGSAGDQQLLTWDLTAQGIILAPAQSVTQTFQAQASVATGTYCNQAWANAGGSDSGSGPTAKVIVGNPSRTLCVGQAAQVTKTVDNQVVATNGQEVFTYTISATNLSTETLNMDSITDLLPPGFSFIPGSVTGNITTSDPAISYVDGQQYLSWQFSMARPLGPGITKTLTFQAQANLSSPGLYTNETWTAIAEYESPVSTWPTAEVLALDVFRVSLTGPTAATMEVWGDGAGGYVVQRWEIGN